MKNILSQWNHQVLYKYLIDQSHVINYNIKHDEYNQSYLVLKSRRRIQIRFAFIKKGNAFDMFKKYWVDYFYSFVYK